MTLPFRAAGKTKSIHSVKVCFKSLGKHNTVTSFIPCVSRCLPYASCNTGAFRAFLFLTGCTHCQQLYLLLLHLEADVGLFIFYHKQQFVVLDTLCSYVYCNKKYQKVCFSCIVSILLMVLTFSQSLYCHIQFSRLD